MAVKTETLTLDIRLGHFGFKIKGNLYVQILNVGIISGLNWLRKLKPVINWESSVLTVARNGVNYKFYPYSSDHRMKEFMFVCLVETKTSPKLNLDTCNFKEIHFYKVILSQLRLPFVKDFTEVFKRLYLVYRLVEK